jgi:hypothetical protein
LTALKFEAVGVFGGVEKLTKMLAQSWGSPQKSAMQKLHYVYAVDPEIYIFVKGTARSRVEEGI